MMIQYKIVQLKDAKLNYAFRNYSYAIKHGFAYDDYTIKYEGYIEAETHNEALEILFEKFNNERPKDFKGHSLSVSDIVELDGSAYYCNPFGWRLL